MKNEKQDQMVFYYLKKALQGPQSSDDTKSRPLKDAFLFVIYDYFQGKLTLEDISSITKGLRDLHFFSSDLTGEDPILFGMMDIAIYAAADIQDQKLLPELKDYLDKNRLTIKRYQEASQSLSGDLKTKLKENGNDLK